MVSQINQEIPSNVKYSNVDEVPCHNGVDTPTKIAKMEEDHVQQKVSS